MIQINIQGQDIACQTRAEHKRSRGVHTVSRQERQNANTEGRRGAPVFLGFERTTLIEGTPKLCESASAPGFSRTGASGGPDRTRLSTYQ